MAIVTNLGIDLHAKNSLFYAFNNYGEVVLNEVVPNHWPAIDAALTHCDGRVIAAVEAGGNWPWLVYGLQARGCEVRLLHPNSVAPYRQTRAKNDRIDAALLATLAAEPWRAKNAWICPNDWLWLRAQLRARVQLIGQRTMVRNRIHGLLKQDNRRAPVSSMFGPVGQAWLREEELPVGLRQALQPLQAVEQEIAHQVFKLEQRLWRLIKKNPLMKQLASLPQAGPVTAMTIALESGDLARFHNTRSYVAHCGLAPWTFESAGKRRFAGRCPQSNKLLKVTYTEWAFRLLTRGGPAWAKVVESYADHPVGEAKIILGRKLAGAVRALAVRGEDFVISKFIRHAAPAA